MRYKFRRMVFEHSDYRAFLKSTLSDRIAQNPAYSLRAMARHLEMSPALLSLIHRKKRNLPLGRALPVAQKLGLDSKETDYFCTLVQFDAAKSAGAKAALLDKMRTLNTKREIKEIEVDSFKVISDWYHFPILMMVDLRRFKFEPRNVARRLGISIIEAEVAIERLLRLGLLQRLENGKYARPAKHVGVKSEHGNEALRQFHRQMLQKAAESLETQTNDEKFVGSETFSIDVSQLPEANEIIEDCFQRLISLFNRGKTRTETYHFGMQLFRLTRRAGSL